MQSIEKQTQIRSQIDLQINHHINPQINVQTNPSANSLNSSQDEPSFSVQVSPQANVNTHIDSLDKPQFSIQDCSQVNVQVDHQVSVHDGLHFGPSDGPLVDSQDIYLQLINDLSKNQPRPGESIRQQETSNQKLSCQSNSKTDPCKKQKLASNEESSSATYMEVLPDSQDRETYMEVLPDSQDQHENNVYDFVDDSQARVSRPSIYSDDRQCSSEDSGNENYRQDYLPLNENIVRHTLLKRKIIYLVIGVTITASIIALVWLVVINNRHHLTLIDSEAHQHLNATPTAHLELSESQTSRLIVISEILEVQNFTRSLWKVKQCLDFRISSSNESVHFKATICPNGYLPMHINYVGVYLGIISMPVDSLHVLGSFSILMANGIYTNFQTVDANLTTNMHLSSEDFVKRRWVQDTPNVLQLNDSLFIRVILSYMSRMQRHSNGIDNNQIASVKQFTVKYNWTVCDSALLPGQEYAYYSDIFSSKHSHLPKFQFKIYLASSTSLPSVAVAIACCYRSADSPLIQATLDVNYTMSIFDEYSDNLLFSSRLLFFSYATSNNVDPICDTPRRMLTLKEFTGKGPCTKIQYKGTYNSA